MVISANSAWMKFFIFYLVISALAMSLPCKTVQNVNAYADTSEWVYYGYSPSANYTEKDVEWGAAGTIVHLSSNGTKLTIVGYNDSTHVTIYDITGGQSKVIDSFTVDRMDEHSVLLPLEISFKVVSDNPIAVLIHGGIMYPLSASRLFYPSTDGGYAGKEFIFHAIVIGRGQGHYAYGIESGEITVYDRKGSVIKTLNVQANSTVSLPLLKEDVYRISSTGRIMVYSTGEGFDVCPSVLGGKIGKLFFSSSPRLLIISQEKPTKVRILEAGKGTVLAEKDLAPREAWFINRTIAPITVTSTSDAPKHVLIESTEDIVVYSATTAVPTGGGYTDGMRWIRCGISFIGIKPHEPATLYVVSRAIVFSPVANAQINIGGIKMTVKKGGYKELGASGILTLTSNATIIIQLISQVATENVGTPANPYFIGVIDMRNFGSYLMSPNSVSIEYPPPKKTEEGSNMTYFVAGGAAVAVIAAALVIIFLKKQKS